MASTRPASLSSPAFVLPSSMPMPLRSRTATPSTFTTGVAAAAWIPASASSFPRPTSKSSSNSISSSRTGARPRLTRPPPLNAQPTDEENRPAAHDTKRPRPTGGVGVQWKQLLAYALVALPNLWWAPSPFLASPSSSSSSTGSSPPGAPTATIAFIERLGLTAWPSEAAGLTDEQQLVADVWKRVDKMYLDRTFNGQDWFGLRMTALKRKYKTTQEVYDAIKAMLEPLGDPYTRFLPPAQYDSLYGLATGSVAGVGVSLFIDPGTQELTVAEVEKGSPAEAAGLQSGDQLVSIDGTQTKGLLVDDCAAILRGPPGVKVGVVAKAKNGGGTKDLIITRQVIKIQSVEASVQKLKGKPIGVIRIRSFSQTTADTVAQELEKLEKQGIVAVVLDLRGNSGGFLGGGIDTARLFLPAFDKIVSVVGKTGIVEEYQTTDEGREISKPLFILVDKRTASASEVLSAALKENGRAKLVGEKTFGKGVVQTIEEVGQGCGVSVTIAAYSTPLGNNINKKGIEVDVPSQCEPSDAAAACLPESLVI